MQINVGSTCIAIITCIVDDDDYFFREILPKVSIDQKNIRWKSWLPMMLSCLSSTASSPQEDGVLDAAALQPDTLKQAIHKKQIVIRSISFYKNVDNIITVAAFVVVIRRQREQAIHQLHHPSRLLHCKMKKRMHFHMMLLSQKNQFRSVIINRILAVTMMKWQSLRWITITIRMQQQPWRGSTRMDPKWNDAVAMYCWESYNEFNEPALSTLCSFVSFPRHSCSLLSLLYLEKRNHVEVKWRHVDRKQGLSSMHSPRDVSVWCKERAVKEYVIFVSCETGAYR